MPIGRFANKFAKSAGYQSLRPLRTLGGLNEDEVPTALLPGQLRFAENCIRRGSATGTRPGVTYGDADYNEVIDTTPDAIQGIHEYRYNAGASRVLLAIEDGDVYVDHANANVLDKTTNSVQITAGDSNFWTFADYQDKVFATGGSVATQDDIWWYDGTNPLDKLDPVTDLGLTNTPKYVFEKWNVLFLGGFTGASTGSDNPMLSRYSNYAEDATLAVNWPASNSIPGVLLDENFGVGSFGSEYNTGFGSFQDNRGDFLLFLTNKRIMSFQPRNPITSNADMFRLVDTIATGCVSQNAFVDLGVDVGDAVYMSEDGIHSIVQSQEYGDKANALLSWDIRRTWDNLDREKMDQAYAAYWQTEGIVLFLVSEGSGTNNLILAMDIKGAQRLTPESVRWYKWRLASGIVPSVMKAARDSNGKPYIYVGGTLGQVCRFERDSYSDLGQAYRTDFRTFDDDFDMPSKEKDIGDTFFQIQGNGDYEISHQLVLEDGQRNGAVTTVQVPSAGALFGAGLFGTGKFGSELRTNRQRVASVGSSNTVSQRFFHTGANEPFWVGLVDQQVAVSGPGEDEEANTVV